MKLYISQFRLCLAALLVVPLLGGCLGFHRGIYDVSETANGWRKHRDGELTHFTYTEWAILRSQITAEVGFKSEIHFTIGPNFSKRYFDSLKFLDDKIQVVFHDHNDLKKNIDANGLLSTDGQTVAVENSEDFSVTLPSFSQNGKTIPPLSVRFHWSNRKFLEFVDQ